MPTITVGNMLDKVHEYEELLDKLYGDIRDRASRDNVRLLTYRLARERKQVSPLLGNLPAGQVERLRTAPLRHADTQFLPERCFEGEYLASNAKPSELLDTAIHLVDLLACFNRWLVNEAVDVDAKKLIERLTKLEEKEIIDLTTIKAVNKF